MTQLLQQRASTRHLTRDEVIEECYNRMRPLALRYGRMARHTTADDLQHDAMVKVLATVDKAMEMDEPVGYLYCVGRSTIFDMLRNDDLVSGDHRTRGNDRVLSLDMPMTEHGDTLADYLLASTQLSNTRQWGSLYAALKQCGPVSRQAVMYRYGMQDDTYEPQTADVSPACIKNRTHIAIRKLRKILSAR